MEIAYVPVGTRGVVANGSNLSIPVAGGALILELQPPAPADAKGMALAVALFLAGDEGNREQTRYRSIGKPKWLRLLPWLPILSWLFAYLPLGIWASSTGSDKLFLDWYWLGKYGSIVPVFGSSISTLAVHHSGWALAERAIIAKAIAIIMLVFVLLVAIGFRCLLDLN